MSLFSGAASRGEFFPNCTFTWQSSELRLKRYKLANSTRHIPLRARHQGRRARVYAVQAPIFSRYYLQHSADIGLWLVYTQASPCSMLQTHRRHPPSFIDSNPLLIVDKVSLCVMYSSTLSLPIKYSSTSPGSSDLKCKHDSTTIERYSSPSLDASKG